MKEQYARQNQYVSNFCGDIDRYLFDRTHRYDSQKSNLNGDLWLGRPLGDAIFASEEPKEECSRDGVLRDGLFCILSEKNEITGQEIGNFGCGYRTFRCYPKSEIHQCIAKEDATINIKIN